MDAKKLEVLCVFIPGNGMKMGDPADPPRPDEIEVVERLPMDTAFSVYADGGDWPVTFVVAFTDDSLAPEVQARMREGLLMSGSFGQALDTLKLRIVRQFIHDYASLPDFWTLFGQSARRMAINITRDMMTMLGNDIFLDTIVGTVKFYRNDGLGGPCLCCPGGNHVYRKEIDVPPFRSQVLAGGPMLYSVGEFVTEWLNKNQFQGIEGRQVRVTIEVIDAPPAADQPELAALPTPNRSESNEA